jgi:hypothetical protein
VPVPLFVTLLSIHSAKNRAITMSSIVQEKVGRQPQEADPLLHPIKDATDKEKGDATAETSYTASGGSNQMFEAVKESFENAMETVRENVKELGHDLMHEAQEVADVMDQKLQEADDSVMPVLDMALARALSILPSDLAKVAAAMHDIGQDYNASVFDDPPLLDANDDATSVAPMLPVAAPGGESIAPSKIPLYAFLILGLAVVGLSGGGPILEFQADCSPLMKVVWRQNGTILMLLPFLRADIKKNGLPRLSCAEWTTFLFTVVGYACANICFVQALEYTTVGNAGEECSFQQRASALASRVL